MSTAARPGVLLRAARPTARATAWSPLVALALSLLLLAGLFRLRDTSSDTLVLMGAAAVAAALVLAVRDPADGLLAAVPVSRLTRRLLRVGLLAAVAVPLWLGVTLLLPGAGSGLAPLVALAASGFAVATWLPGDRSVLPAATVPLVWAVADQLLGAREGLLGDVTGVWVSHPWPVAGVAVLLVAVGRHR